MSNIDVGKLWEQFERMEANLHDADYTDEAQRERIYWMKRVHAEQMTTAEQHSIWCSKLYAEGWKPGELTSEAEKTHVMLRPFDLLSAEAQRTLYMFSQFAWEAGEIIESLQEEEEPAGEG